MNDRDESTLRLQGRVAVITGAAGAGIGSATARRLAAEGAAVVVTDTSERRVTETTRSLKDSGAVALGLTMDVSDRSAVNDAVDRINEQLGPIDILINSAAINILGPVHELSSSDWDQMIAANLSGPWYVIRTVLPGMMELNRGSIVNIASVAAYMPAGAGAAYAATKAALISLTRSVASEAGIFGVRCNAVAPGIVESRFFDKQRDQLAPEIGRTPLRRFARPEEVANTIAFLVSDESAFITGETIAVSGGWYMRA